MEYHEPLQEKVFTYAEGNNTADIAMLYTPNGTPILANITLNIHRTPSPFTSSISAAQAGKKRKPYFCSKCGLAKKGHNCGDTTSTIVKTEPDNEDNKESDQNVIQQKVSPIKKRKVENTDTLQSDDPNIYPYTRIPSINYDLPRLPPMANALPKQSSSKARPFVASKDLPLLEPMSAFELEEIEESQSITLKGKDLLVLPPDFCKTEDKIEDKI